jgi:hypothetical protein
MHGKPPFHWAAGAGKSKYFTPILGKKQGGQPVVPFTRFMHGYDLRRFDGILKTAYLHDKIGIL